jgi:uncharacterized membrane protein YvbJ
MLVSNNEESIIHNTNTDPEIKSSVSKNRYIDCFQRKTLIICEELEMLIVILICFGINFLLKRFFSNTHPQEFEEAVEIKDADTYEILFREFVIHKNIRQYKKQWNVHIHFLENEKSSTTFSFDSFHCFIFITRKF